ncbi:MAG: hypothetical protein KGH64_01790 [Candidatus Micrarchaeota archaeon]|nr:hypothetical protein [Candidatus Micrarchaeota archaeon]MDE1859185.1 hypothetical protein [Candidatus Micrarchaeota archaeon]
MTQDTKAIDFMNNEITVLHMPQMRCTCCQAAVDNIVEWLRCKCCPYCDSGGCINDRKEDHRFFIMWKEHQMHHPPGEELEPGFLDLEAARQDILKRNGLL